MGNQRLFLIDKKEGLSLEFSKLISMMNYTRETTLAEIMNLSVEQLDFLINEKANSIGMLIAHMASLEKAYQIDTFEKREFTEEDIQMLNPAMDLGKAAQEQIKGNSIEFYLEQLEQTRKKTIEEFRTLQDSWLFEQTPFWGGKPTNNYFKWFHVFEDELNHRGQIRLIKKIINLSAK
ncbi:DinB family protein [Sporosarcina thermotolerans]|uniref:DinB family protein n=1 Tax=Sporosarcina thermotolerans TaxID=633404 RepID=A0AAW9ACZ4_9BACL|nr:DinB family protein [Sporosarcina thermotolerans]MDW0117011.1 DinB family protein [Sporosarcina thermotolerans]WHT47885.1 DinB family protein [Sporosarcina thermotolerans]